MWNKKSEGWLSISVNTHYGDFPKYSRKILESPEKSKILENDFWNWNQLNRTTRKIKSILYVVSRTDTVIRTSGIRGLQNACSSNKMNKSKKRNKHRLTNRTRTVLEQFVYSIILEIMLLTLIKRASNCLFKKKEMFIIQIFLHNSLIFDCLCK